jgi:hypothetical protein
VVGHSGKISSMDFTYEPPPFSRAVADAVLSPDELDPATIVSGDPRTAGLVLHEQPAAGPGGRTVERGIWEITPGVVTDVEADEMFVVLSGRATIQIQDGPTLEVGPGDMAVVPEGAVTRWTVHETLRKVYQLSYIPEGE